MLSVKNVTKIIEHCCNGFQQIDNECVSQCPYCKNGICKNGECYCNSGWNGVNCDSICLVEQFSSNCNKDDKICNCPKYLLCEAQNPKDCDCITGWIANSCDKPCPRGNYGKNCRELCTCHSKLHSCTIIGDDCYLLKHGDITDDNIFVSTNTSTISSENTILSTTEATEVTSMIFTENRTPPTTEVSEITSTKNGEMLKINVTERTDDYVDFYLENISTDTSQTHDTQKHSTEIIEKDTVSENDYIELTNSSKENREKYSMEHVDTSPDLNDLKNSKKETLEEYSEEYERKDTSPDLGDLGNLKKETLEEYSEEHERKSTSPYLINLRNSKKGTLEEYSEEHRRKDTSSDLIGLENSSKESIEEGSVKHVPVINQETITGIAVTEKIPEAKSENNDLILAEPEEENLDSEASLETPNTIMVLNGQKIESESKKYALDEENHILKTSKPDTQNTLQDEFEHMLETPKITEQKNFLIEEENKDINQLPSKEHHLLHSISAATATAVGIILMAVIFFTVKSVRKNSKKEEEHRTSRKNDVASVAVYTTSIFHTPLPDPPTYENPVYLTPSEYQNAPATEPKAFETRVVCSVNIKNHLKNADCREYVYDHPPSTGSYRAASTIDAVSEVDLSHKSSLAQLEPVYDEIPCRGGASPLTANDESTLGNPNYKQPQSSCLYINTCGRTRF